MQNRSGEGTVLKETGSPNPEQPPRIHRAIRLDGWHGMGLLALGLFPVLAACCSPSQLAGDQIRENLMDVIAIYIMAMVGFRIIGKREFSEFSPVELVMLILIPEVASQAFDVEPYALLRALTGVALIMMLVFINSTLVHRFPKLERLMSGEPTILVADGKMIAAHLNRERVSPQEIYAAMHEHGIEKLEDVRWIILETDGKLSVIRGK